MEQSYEKPKMAHSRLHHANIRNDPGCTRLNRRMAHHRSTCDACCLGNLHDSVDESWTRQWERQTMTPEEQIMRTIAQMIHEMHSMRMEIERLRKMLHGQHPSVVNNTIRVDI